MNVKELRYPIPPKDFPNLTKALDRQYNELGIEFVRNFPFSIAMSRAKDIFGSGEEEELHRTGIRTRNGEVVQMVLELPEDIDLVLESSGVFYGAIIKCIDLVYKETGIVSKDFTLGAKWIDSFGGILEVIVKVPPDKEYKFETFIDRNEEKGIYELVIRPVK